MKFFSLGVFTLHLLCYWFPVFQFSPIISYPLNKAFLLQLLHFKAVSKRFTLMFTTLFLKTASWTLLLPSRVNFHFSEAYLGRRKKPYVICTKHIMPIISCNCISNSAEDGLLSPFYRWRKRSTNRKVTHFTKINKLVHFRCTRCSSVQRHQGSHTPTVK